MNRSEYVNRITEIAQAWVDGEADYHCEMECRYLAEQAKLRMDKVLQDAYDERVILRGW